MPSQQRVVIITRSMVVDIDTANLHSDEIQTLEGIAHLSNAERDLSPAELSSLLTIMAKAG